uniref:Peroxinectin n=1 Tax=Hydra vulgaris TaxID=6087 RepID=V9GVG1_HYDVU
MNRCFTVIFLVIFLTDINCDSIQTRLDKFARSTTQTLQKFTDNIGNEWNRNSDINKLEVLQNDVLYLEHYKTCQQPNNINSFIKNTSNKTFEEVAQKVGFNKVHRNGPPLRPDCRFDYVLLSKELNITSRLYGELCLMEMLTGGAAVGDYDNDGFQDVFYTIATEPSVLYRNNGDGTFTDVTYSANVGPTSFGNGVGWIDVDADGDLDLYVTTVGDNRHYLYINQGGRFTEEAQIRGVSMQFPNMRNLAGMTPTFGDFDLDGYIDIYVSEWIFHFYGEVTANRLLRNLGKEKPGFFEDVTDKAGVNMDGFWKYYNRHSSGTLVFGASFTDFNNDGWPELLITGDFFGSKMFWNNKNGTFTECSESCGMDVRINAMGHTIGDLNRDGFDDVMLTGIYFSSTACNFGNCLYGPSGNAFYQNKKNGTFTNIEQEIGVKNGYWAWGASFIDFDNDCKLDIVSTNGMNTFETVLDDEYTKGKMQLFHNQGNLNNTMIDVAANEGIQYNGQGRGLLVFDFEDDGDLDVLVVPNFGPVQFFKNKGSDAYWIRVRVFHKCLNDVRKLCDSYGARVSLNNETEMYQTSSIGSKTNYLGQSELTAHFGLGKIEVDSQVTVFWPRTKQQVTVIGVPVNTKLDVIQPDGNINMTIMWSEIAECPYLFIKYVSQPGIGKIVINQDMKSLKYDPSPLTLFDVGEQTFKYTVAVKPDSFNLQSMGMVELDMRTVLGYTICNGSFPANTLFVKSTSERRLDGKSNNMGNVNWGSVSQPLIQLAPRFYADNISDPASACSLTQRINSNCPYPKEFSGLGSNRPSPRLISNVLMKQIDERFSKRNISDFTWHYGQFIIHDTDHTTLLPRFEFQYYENHVWMPITIPKGDVYFDPYNTGQQYMPFVRSQYNKCTGMYPGNSERKQLNTISAYIDGSMIYGSSVSRCAGLREFKDGKMKLENSFPPKNVDALPNENPTGRPYDQLYAAGDIRSNVQPGLMALHTLFLREHNRLAQNYLYNNPMASDEEIFQKTRRLVIAELQSVTYNEYLPAILGGKLPKYNGYNKSINVDVSNEFATAAFRFGHSQVNSFIFRLKPDGTPIDEGHAILREVYFKPHRLEREGGLDPLLRGTIKFRSQEVDMLMVDEMRNTLFPTSDDSTGTHSGFDLAALNIQRGRDHGLADFNTVRKYLGLKAYKSFSEITSDKSIAKNLELLYENVDNIDLWVGGLAEDHVKDSELGETFHKIILEQFIRFRDGDRFWYEKNLTTEEIADVESRSLGKIIRLNTGFTDCPDNVFFSSENCIGVKNHQCIPRLFSNDKFFRTANDVHFKDKHNEQGDKIKLLIILASVFGAFSGLLLVIAFVCLKLKVHAGNEISSNNQNCVVNIGNNNKALETVA